jgi:hypothetical protein
MCNRQVCVCVLFGGWLAVLLSLIFSVVWVFSCVKIDLDIPVVVWMLLLFLIVKRK